jgi:hypothetical protein
MCSYLFKTSSSEIPPANDLSLSYLCLILIQNKICGLVGYFRTREQHSDLLHEEDDSSADVSAAEQALRERRPTPTNSNELLDLMRQTRQVRRDWIHSNAPTISEILTRFPRFVDLQDSVSYIMLDLI